MLTEDQVGAIAETLCHQTGKTWSELNKRKQNEIKKQVFLISSKAIALQAESDRRSFTAVGKYIGVNFTATTDVVSEVYNKLEEIMSVFREHSQEIAIAQQIKHLNNLLERYVQQQEAPPIQPGGNG
jgi:DNA gyrase/topoisomerase IV subunit A